MDEVATVQGRYIPAASNPVLWKRYIGGVGCNVARAAQTILSRNPSNGSVRFHAALGEDHAGQTLFDRLQSDELLLEPQYITGCSTGRYSVVVDQSGQLVLGLADVQLAERLQATAILPRLKPEMTTTLVLDANLSPACIAALAETAQNACVPVIALAVSPSKALRLLPLADKIDLLFCNRREAQALVVASDRLTDPSVAEQLSLHELAEALVTSGFRDFVVTDAADALVIMCKNTVTRVPVPPIQIKHNVNGAGDALAGATIAAWVMGKPLHKAVTDYGLELAAGVLSGRRLPLPL